MSDPFILSIEPVGAPTFQYGFHLGTDEALARRIAEEKFHARNLSPIKSDIGGVPMATRTVALFRKGKMIDCYDGVEWSSQREWPTD